MDVISYSLSKKYTDEKNIEQKLKVAKLEQELNNYKAVMSQMNINQEATQKASGYGIISLPKNAANGQVSDVVIRGRTLKQEFNYNKDTMEQWSILSNSTKGESKITLKGTGGYSDATLPIFVKPNTKYGILYTVLTSNVPSLNLGAVTYPFADAAIPTLLGNVKIIRTTKKSWTANLFRFYLTPDSTDEHSITISTPRMFELPPGSEIETDFNTLSADQLAQKYPYISGGSAKSTVSAIRLKSVDKDGIQESTLYLPNVGELRSLPNGVKDEIRVSGGKAELIKRVNEKTLNGSENWTAVSSLTNVYRASLANNFGITDKTGNNAKMIIGNIEYPYIFNYTEDTEHWYWDGNGVLFISKSKKDSMAGSTLMEKWKNYLSQNPATLIYQLAEPVEIPIEVSGNIVSYPSGTIYIERVVPDAGIYTDRMSVLHQDLPIKVLEKLSKINFMTGLETELDVSDAVIAENKLSFTHPDLVDGDIVFFTYEYDRESTEGETEIEYYDSRYVIKDSVTGKFYKWKIAVNNGTPSIELEEV